MFGVCVYLYVCVHACLIQTNITAPEDLFELKHINKLKQINNVFVCEVVDIPRYIVCLIYI